MTGVQTCALPIYAIAVTTIFHMAMKFLGLGLAFLLGMIAIGGFDNLQAHLIKTGSPQNLYNPFSVNLNYAFTLILGGILGGMAAQASIQPIFAAKDPITAKHACFLSSLIIAPFGIIVAFLGLIAKTGIFFDTSTLSSPKAALTTLLTTPEFIHPVFGALAISGILAAILSTVGPVNFAIVTIATKDIYHNFINPEAKEENVLKISKKLVILVNFITIPMAIFIHDSVLDAAYISYSIRAIGAIVIISGLYLRGWITVSGAKMAFIGGTLAMFICIFASKFGFFDIDKTYGAIAVAIIFIILGKFIDKFYR